MPCQKENNSNNAVAILVAMVMNNTHACNLDPAQFHHVSCPSRPPRTPFWMELQMQLVWVGDLEKGRGPRRVTTL